MRELDESDPQRIVGMAMAANNLTSQGERVASPDDVEGILLNIALLRAGAHGWREAQMAFKGQYEGRKARDAAHDASLTAKYAKDADRHADELCNRIALPVEYQGHHESLARLFWFAFRNIYSEVDHHKTSWLLFSLALADCKTEDAGHDRAFRDAILERASDAGISPQVFNDAELTANAREAAWAMLTLLKAYRLSAAKAVLN